MVLKPAAGGPQPSTPLRTAPRDDGPPTQKRRRVAVIADEPRPFRSFLAEHLRRLGFDVTMFETGEPAFDREGAVALWVEQLEPHRLGDVRLGRDLAGQDLRHRIVGVDAAVAGELIEARLRRVA